MMRHVALIGLCGLLLFAAARDRFDQWVAQTVLPPLVIDTSVEVRDRNGLLLRAYTVDDGLWRLGVSNQQVDPKFIEMLIAFEDKRFYRHTGVDIRAMLRAAGQAAWHGKVVSGGSTLTMQVARLLEDGPTGEWAGKLRQIRVALALEHHLSKSEILSLYLHLAPYGGNLEGVRAATLAWFGKEPHRLTPAQSALLVALPQSPERRRPDRNLDAALGARDMVLDRVAHVLDTDAVFAAKSEPVSPQKHEFPLLAAHLADRMKRENPLQRAHQTTLDKHIQTALEDLASRSVLGRQDRLSVAILVADHQTGQVIASVGSGGYDAADQRQGFIDMTQAVRSPGSTLKPLVYGLAFDQGLVHPETVIDDRPVRVGAYAPQNFDGQFRGELRVSEALRLSLNIPVVLLTDELGPARLLSAMQKSGAKATLQGGQPGLAIALGGVGFTLENLVGMYAMLGRGGEAIILHYDPHEPVAGPRVLGRASAWHVTHVLAGLAPPVGAPNMRIAYKTGTSYGHRDTWAIGYDGQHVIGVWMGRADGTPVPGAFGAELAAPVLFKAFQRVKPEAAPFAPPPPEALLLPTAQLPQPLQRFRGRNAVFAKSADAPKLAFPPDGAQVQLTDGQVVIKLMDGVPPFTLLANGMPVHTGLWQHEAVLQLDDIGFFEFSVIDALGRADHVHVDLR